LLTSASLRSGTCKPALADSKVKFNSDPDEREDLIGSWQYILDTTGVPSLISSAIRCLAPGGKCGLVSAAQSLSISPSDLAGRTLTLLPEGNTDPQVFVPQLIRYWQEGRLPVEKLVQTYPLSEINQAACDAKAGIIVKPLLIPDPLGLPTGKPPGHSLHAV
jgi:aryl-alcohol dehydrogenase